MIKYITKRIVFLDFILIPSLLIVKGDMMKKLFAAVLIFMIITFGVFFDFRTKSPLPLNIPKTETLIVPIHSLKTQSFTYTKSFIGSVEAIQSVAIVPYLSGFLKEVHVNSGSKVNQGDVLFLLDERIPSAELEQAKETVVQAFSARANAENYYNRIKNTERKAISATELEQARTTFEEADATYQKALGAQKQAQTLYDYTVIKAPISGWVGNITATVGEYLSPQGKILANLIGFSPIRLIFSIPMSAYQDNIDLKKAQLKVILENGQTLEFKNFQVIQDNQTNKTTDSLSFFIDVPNEDRF